MKLRMKNRTDEPQFINLTDGSSVKIPPLGETVIDSWNIYKEEMERLRIFFSISLDFIVAEPVTETVLLESGLIVEEKKEKVKRTYTRRKKKEIEDEIEENVNYFDDMEVS